MLINRLFYNSLYLVQLQGLLELPCSAICTVNLLNRLSQYFYSLWGFISFINSYLKSKKIMSSMKVNYQDFYLFHKKLLQVSYMRLLVAVGVQLTLLYYYLEIK